MCVQRLSKTCSITFISYLIFYLYLMAKTLQTSQLNTLNIQHGGLCRRDWTTRFSITTIAIISPLTMENVLYWRRDLHLKVIIQAERWLQTLRNLPRNVTILIRNTCQPHLGLSAVTRYWLCSFNTKRSTMRKSTVKHGLHNLYR